MRRLIRSLVIMFVALAGVIGVAFMSTLSMAVALAATALIVPGTGTPDANIVSGYLEQSRNRYLTTTACGADGSGCPDADLHGINYPASFFPLVIFPGWCRSGPDGCDTWDKSVGMGADALQAQLADALNNTNEDVVVFGYSQGGAVVADVLDGYISGLPSEQKARIQVVTIGGIENPDGGLWQRLAFLNYIPILNISFNPAIKADSGVNITSYGFEYDPVVNAPRYFGNPFALVNALAAFENVHGYYLAPNGNGPTDALPFGYTDATLATQLDCAASPANCRYDPYGNTYVTIPALTLPIYDFVLGALPGPLLPVLKPLVNLVTPVTRLLIDLGYNYSGDPSVPTPLSILPLDPFTFQPVEFSEKFVAAVAEGIHDATHGGPAPAPAPGQTQGLSPGSKPPTIVPVDIGPIGPQGAKGPKPGAVATPESVSTLASSNSASASKSTAAKSVGSPTGAAGQGSPVSVASAKGGTSASTSDGAGNQPGNNATPANTSGAGNDKTAGAADKDAA